LNPANFLSIENQIKLVVLLVLKNILDINYLRLRLEGRCIESPKSCNYLERVNSRRRNAVDPHSHPKTLRKRPILLQEAINKFGLFRSESHLALSISFILLNFL